MSGALAILAKESPAFRRDEIMIALRRELVALCRQAAYAEMTNGETLIVLNVLSDLPASVIGDANAARLEACRQSITEFIDLSTLTSTARRLLLLAGDAYHTAAVALGEKAPSRAAQRMAS